MTNKKLIRDYLIKKYQDLSQEDSISLVDKMKPLQMLNNFETAWYHEDCIKRELEEFENIQEDKVTLTNSRILKIKEKLLYVNYPLPIGNRVELESYGGLKQQFFITRRIEIPDELAYYELEFPPRFEKEYIGGTIKMIKL